MPRVLILSTTTGYQLRSFSDAAAALGIELTFATDRCHTLEDPWQDAAVPVRFHEDEASLQAILRAAETRPMDGLIAVGDRPVVLAARAAAALRLPGNPPEAARASAHKRLTREALSRARLPVPWFISWDLEAQAVPRADIAYPAVVKPVGLSGSRGVIRVNDGAELHAAIERIRRLLSRPEIRAQRTGTERELLVEGFIPGREFALEGVLTAGRLTPLALFDKPDPLDGPFFEETIYLTPSAGEPAVQRAIEDAVQRASAALGLRHGPVHAECRVNADGVFVLEVAARPIGGLCSRVLRFAADGSAASPDGAGTVPLEHLLLRHAVGDDVTGVRREASAAAVMMIPVPRRGVYRRVEGEDGAREVRFVEDVRITAKPDQLLEPLPEAGSYVGFIFARAPERELAAAAVREAHRRLAFVVEPAIGVRTVTA